MDVRVTVDETGPDLNNLNTWYQQPFGRMLKSQIADALMRNLKSLPVHELLHLGVGGFEEVLAGQKGERMIFFTDMACQHLLAKEENSLPLKEGSQECVVLLHALDVAADPYGVLREINRIMSVRGYLVIVGFNAFSSWGLYRPLRNLYPWKRTIPWALQFYTIGRLRDWLALLGFDISQSRTLSFLPLAQKEKLLGNLQIADRLGALLLPFFGNVYILTAQKRVTPLTPVLDRKFRSALLKPGL
ncbi:MAG TPA: methyltransferase domain-containing protein, partial [Gammaproteobacteria bacterium]